MELIEENASLPDLEKLERYEFNLDEEERQRLIGLGEQSVKQVSGRHGRNCFISRETVMTKTKPTLNNGYNFPPRRFEKKLSLKTWQKCFFVRSLRSNAGTPWS
jgi:hypothetical protein